MNRTLPSLPTASLAALAVAAMAPWAGCSTTHPATDVPTHDPEPAGPVDARTHRADGGTGTAPDALAKTYMCKRGKLLLEDDFDRKGDGWRGGLGSWSVVDGAFRAAEDPADHHRAIIKHALDYRDAVVQVAFKLAGATLTGVEMDWGRGGGDDHVCRIEVTPSQLRVRTDTGGTRYLARRPVTIEQGKWHTLLVEVRGGELLGHIDDRWVAFGEDAGNDRHKRYLGLGPVDGAAAEFDGLRVWECLPDPAWPDLKASLSTR